MLPLEQAEQILEEIRRNGNRFASQRNGDYMRKRLMQGSCPWLKAWYIDGQELQIKLVWFPESYVSFIYGDSFPAMNYNDGKPYRGQVYTRHELAEVIERYELPQIWNPDGSGGPERYIEAQIWDDAPLKEYIGVYHY